MWTYASRMHDLRGPLYASESWLHVSWLHHKTFNLSLLFVSSQWRASHTWPCLDEAIGLKSAEESLLQKPCMPSRLMYKLKIFCCVFMLRDGFSSQILGHYFLFICFKCKCIPRTTEWNI